MVTVQSLQHKMAFSWYGSLTPLPFIRIFSLVQTTLKDYKGKGRISRNMWKAKQKIKTLLITLPGLVLVIPFYPLSNTRKRATILTNGSKREYTFVPKKQNILLYRTIILSICLIYTLRLNLTNIDHQFDLQKLVTFDAVSSYWIESLYAKPFLKLDKRQVDLDKAKLPWYMDCIT